MHNSDRFNCRSAFTYSWAPGNMKYVKTYYVRKGSRVYGPYAYTGNRSLGRVYTERELETLESFVETIRSHGIKRIFVLFSGGRDSLVALHLAHRVSRALKMRLKAVHIDTTISTPGNLEYVETTCKRLGIELIVVRPKRTFFDLVERWGFPTATRRWCCYHLKIEPLKRYFAGERPLDDALVVDGIRRDESPRRQEFPKLGYHKHIKALCYHPIFEWDKKDVLEYIANHNLRENPLYECLPRAAECWCTAFKTARQFKILKQICPELFAKFVELEAKLRTGGSALFSKGRRIYLRDL